MIFLRIDWGFIFKLYIVLEINKYKIYKLIGKK